MDTCIMNDMHLAIWANIEYLHITAMEHNDTYGSLQWKLLSGRE